MSRSVLAAGAAAIGIHGVVLAVLLPGPEVRRSPASTERALDPAPTVEIEVSSESPASSPSRTAASSLPVEPSAAPLANASEPTTRPAEGAPESPPTEAVPPFRGVTMGGAPVGSATIGLELGAPNRFATGEGPPERPERPAPPPDEHGDRPRTSTETKRAVETALRAPARQRERELGLGPEGPVLAALGEATSASTAPVHGRAVFVAIADRTGLIVGIDVVECDGAHDGWAKAAELARTALRGKKLRMPSTATRAEMRIEVSSEWKMPTGHDPGVDVSVFGVPVAKGEGKQSSSVSILDPIPKIKVVELAPDVKVPIPVIGLDALAIHGDPADLGAKPRRIVHTRLLDSKVL